MDTFDFVIIGAGPAGEAAAFKARERGATVAIVDREWFGGSCPFIGCLPSKALLYTAARHAANGPAFNTQLSPSTYITSSLVNSDTAAGERHRPVVLAGVPCRGFGRLHR